jgi:acyl-coenzyme A synthetase/AMP-(fatty) acid ligase
MTSPTPIDWLLERMAQYAEGLAVATGVATATYADVLAATKRWSDFLVQMGLEEGQVVTIEGEYDLETIALLFAATARQLILVPLSADSGAQHERFRQLASVQWRLGRQHDRPWAERISGDAEHPYYRELRAAGNPGLVLFTSGSTGESKAAVHDLSLILEKFRTPRQQLRTLVFLQLDHIGGINTLFYTVANGGAVVAPQDRSPEAVCNAIERHGVELLPTSPTFLNLLLLSGAVSSHDLRSLRLITYGTEPMPPSTLERLSAAFPNVKLQQTYGLTELGILRSQSRDSSSLWVRVGGEGFETKVVDGRLWIRARSAMFGYLNAPSPFDADGYFDTGDRVEVDGEWLRILGRESELINVGGSKVYPAEVESVLLQMEGVVDVAVRGEPHPITGRVVVATVRLARPESPRDFRTRMRQFCQRQLPDFAIPARVEFTEERLHNSRFKRIRRHLEE